MQLFSFHAHEKRRLLTDMHIAERVDHAGIATAEDNSK